MSRHRFHGDPQRFEIMADYVADRYWKSVTYIADVAGGQGMLSRILAKKYHYTCEVVDPRGWLLPGVKHQQAEFDPQLARYYDLVIGLHPDEATRAVVHAALAKPVIIVPCCNFWSEEKLGQKELLQAIEEFYRSHSVPFERVTLPFKGPKNKALVSEPPTRG